MILLKGTLCSFGKEIQKLEEGNVYNMDEVFP